jgi:hypothetical protein
MGRSISWFEFFISVQFEELTQFTEHVEEFLEQKVKEVESSYEEHAKELGLSGEDLTELFEHMYEEDYHNFNKSFPNILRKALFLHSYAVLEQQLLNLCKHYEKTQPDSILLKDLRHSGINKAQVYLKKVVGINFPDTSEEWKKLNINYNLIRNHFAHSGQQTISSATKGDLLKALNETPGVETKLMFMDPDSKEKFYDFRLKKEFCIEFISLINTFLLIVNKEVQITH